MYKDIITDLPNFRKWLEQEGAEILEPTNQYEALRFKGSEVGILYKTRKVSSNYVWEAIKCYRKRIKWSGKPINIGRKKRYIKEKRLIIKRDGHNCFYCGYPLHDDVTLEHLISLASGGKNTLGNMVLAHEKCNNRAKNKTVKQKVDLVLKLRMSLKQQNLEFK